MTYGLTHTIRQLYRGQSLLRIRMNAAFSAYTLRGTVVDVGGGHNPDYFSYFKKENGVIMQALDGSMTGIDFERDALPQQDGSVDTIILANVLEHVYNHQFLLAEIRRVLRPGGQMIGFVPFWIGYHPDPHDYFRYTHEALQKMLESTGFKDVCIQPLFVGPLLANFNTIVLSLPRFARPVLYLWVLFWNTLYIRLRPGCVARNPLGYIFTGT